MKYYAVAKGRKPGIYTTWEECSRNVTGYKGAKYKSFTSKEEAEKYYGAFHGNGLPKDKRYLTAQPVKSKYKNTDNCLLCGKPFKQLLAKGGGRKTTPICSLCKKERCKVKSIVYKATSGAVKGLSVSELVYLKKVTKAENIFEYLVEHPWEAMKKQMRNEKDTAHEALMAQRKSYMKDSTIKDIPLYIKEYFGNDKEILSVKGDVRNPMITYHCKRCDCDYKVWWKHYRKVKGHNCNALMSSGEVIVEDYLKKHGISYKTQRDTLKCVNPETGYIMPYDFEITNKKLLIEVQGEQHRKFIEHFHVDQEGFEYQREKDLYKKNYARMHGYRLLEIWYEDINNNAYEQAIENALELY